MSMAASTDMRRRSKALPDDLEALRALAGLYERAGRGDDYLATLEHLARVAPEGERPTIYRRLAVELEDVPGGSSRAIAAFENLIAADEMAMDGYRGLERILGREGRHEELVAALERHLFVTSAPGPKAELCAQLADIHESQLNDPHRAIECHENALAEVADNAPSLAALARLYARTESWRQALDVAIRRAELAPASAAENADRWTDAGRLAFEKLGDLAAAEQSLEKALALDPTHLQATLALAKVHRAEGAWANVVRRLSSAVERSANRLERIELLSEAAEIAEEKLSDADRAASFREEILKLDPEHVESGSWLAQHYRAQKREREMVPILEMLIRMAAGDRLELARRETELAKVHAELGELERARAHFESAVAADAADLDAVLGLADTDYRRAVAGDDVAAWGAVADRYRDILGSHRSGLADGQLTEIWYRVGVASRSQGDELEAGEALRRALEKTPGHAPTLHVLAEVAAARKNWKMVVECKRELAEGVLGSSRVALLEEIGDVCHRELGDAESALSAYLEALVVEPGSHVLLHKVLELYTEQKEWRQAVKTLDALATTESDRSRRAKYHYAAAVIGRDELGDEEVAIDCFQRALEDDPSTPKAFAALDQLLSKRGEWKLLARAHRKMLKKLGDAGPEILLPLWGRLGDICLEHLHDSEAAIAAFEVAASLDAEDLARREQLADLYLEAGESRRDDAIDELQVLVTHQPERIELYRALSELYGAGGDLDKSFCLAQTLCFLGAATEAEAALFESHRPEQFTVAKRRLTEELWLKDIAHRREDRHVSAIFSSVVTELAATTAQPMSAFNAAPEGPESATPVSKVFHYATKVLALSPEPRLSFAKEGEGLRVANAAASGKLAPMIVIGGSHAEKRDERELAFELGRRLAHCRPERYASYALPTAARLEKAFYSAIEAAGVEVPNDHGDPKLAAQLKETVPTAVLEQVAFVARQMDIGERNGVIPVWQAAVELTADRVGFILCNDLATAARLVATDAASSAHLSAKDRLRNLLGYSVSEHYFAVRRHLGLSIGTST